MYNFRLDRDSTHQALQGENGRHSQQLLRMGRLGSSLRRWRRRPWWCRPFETVQLESAYQQLRFVHCQRWPVIQLLAVFTFVELLFAGLSYFDRDWKTSASQWAFQWSSILGHITLALISLGLLTLAFCCLPLEGLNRRSRLLHQTVPYFPLVYLIGCLILGQITDSSPNKTGQIGVATRGLWQCVLFIFCAFVFKETVGEARFFRGTFRSDGIGKAHARIATRAIGDRN